ncbi:ankyrin repeat-containing domain protein [Hypoxylon sp. FL1284]|nr:ankyrin repeat-containing domain protein [Hypoxylon sp. FL1284]
MAIRRVLEVQESSKGIGFAFLYCRHGESQSPLLFVQILVRQLLEQADTITDEIVSHYDKRIKTLQTRSAVDEYEKLLGLVTGLFSKVYIIVDALDECRSDDGSQYRLETKKRFLQTLDSFGESVHILVTSRDETAPKSDGPWQRMRVYTVDEDIESYVQRGVQNTARLQEMMTDDLEKTMKHELVKKAAGIQDILEFLVAHVHHQDVRRRSDGRTLLSLVAGNWQWDYVNILLWRGANVDLLDKMGLTSLIWALKPPRQQIHIKRLTTWDTSQFKIDDQIYVDEYTILSDEYNRVTEENVQPYIFPLIGNELEVRDEDGRTALSLAAENRFHLVLEQLVTKRAEVNTTDLRNMTPLHYACSLPRFKYVSIDDLECRDYSGVQIGPIDFADASSAANYPSSGAKFALKGVNLLISGLASQDAKNHRGLTPRDLAISDSLEGIADRLRPAPENDSYVTVADEKHRARDYYNILISMIGNGSRIRLGRVRVCDNSALDLYSVSDVTYMKVSNRSRASLTSNSFINTLAAYDHSEVQIKGLVTIRSLIGRDESYIHVTDYSTHEGVDVMEYPDLNLKAKS